MLDFESTAPLWVPEHDYLPAMDRSAIYALRSLPGVSGSQDFRCLPTNPPSWNVDVAPGRAIVDGSTNPLLQGSYVCYSPEWRRLSIQPSHPQLDRIDVVVVHVHDQEHSIEEGFGWSREVLTGEPGSGQPPDIPPNCVVLSAWEIRAGSAAVGEGSRPRNIVAAPLAALCQEQYKVTDLSELARSGGWPLDDTSDFRHPAGPMAFIESDHAMHVLTDQNYQLLWSRDLRRPEPYRALGGWPYPMVLDIEVSGYAEPTGNSVGVQLIIHVERATYPIPQANQIGVVQHVSQYLMGSLALQRSYPFPAGESPVYLIFARQWATGSSGFTALHLSLTARLYPRPAMATFGTFDFPQEPPYRPS